MKIPQKSFTGYGKALGDAWRLMWQRPIAFLPVAFAYVGLIILLGALFGWLFFTAQDVGITLTQDITKEMFESIMTPSLISSLIVGGAIFLLLAFIVGFFSAALQLAVFPYVVAEKKLKRPFALGKKFFGRAVGVGLLMFAMVLAPIVVIGLIVLLGTVFPTILGVILFTIAGVAAIAALGAYFILGVWFMIATPIIAFKDVKVIPALKEAWPLLWKDASFVWLTFLINAGITLGVSAVFGIASLAYPTGESMLIFVPRTIINLLVGVFLGLYVYRSVYLRYEFKVA